MRTVDLSEIRIILLTGEEFQRLERLSEILKVTVDDATRDFNFDELRCLDYKREPSEFLTKFSELIMICPMMTERRVIVIRNFDELHKDIRKKVCEIILKTPETTLVIIEGEKVSLSPTPKEYFKSETFKHLYEKLPSWVKERFKKRGKKIGDSAVAHLINNAGEVLLELDNEIEKVIIVAGDKEYVTDEDVIRVVGPFKRETVWGLCKAVGLNDFNEASNILANLMETGKDSDEKKINETTIVYHLNSHIMKISEYNSLIKKGVHKEVAMKVVTQSPFLWKLNKMEEQTRNFNPQMIRRALTVLRRMESTLKRSSIDKKLLMEFLIPLMMPKLKKAEIAGKI